MGDGQEGGVGDPIGLAAAQLVVRYDQLGGGKSDRITDTTLFTIAHFVRELDLLRAHLGYSKVHLLGHSWGTILALEYYRAHPEHVASLTAGECGPGYPRLGAECQAARRHALGLGAACDPDARSAA